MTAGSPVVLIVDDEPSILESLEDLLLEEFRVLTATDGDSALELLARNDVSVILSDQRMPGLRGDQLLARAQEISKATRILLTAYADFRDLRAAVNDGRIFAYLSKPWDPLELKHSVRTAVEHYQLLRALKFERDLLHALMEYSPDSIYFKAPDSRYVRLNQSQARVLGVADPQDAVGLSECDLWPPEPAGAEVAEDAETLRAGLPLVDREKRVSLPDRPPFWLSVTKAPLRDEHGRVHLLACIGRDVTRRKDIEAELRTSLELNRSILQTVPSALFVLKPGLDVEMATPGGLLHGQGGDALAEARDLLGQMLESAPDLAEGIRTVLDVGGSARAPNVLLHGPRDRFLDVRIQGFLEPGRDGEDGRRALLVVDDVTEQRQLEEQIRHGVKMESVGLLAGGVAHDFNNLLTGITGYVELMLGRTKPGSQDAEDLAQVHSLAERAAELTRRLLLFSRRQPARMELLSLNELVRETLKMLSRMLGEQIEVDVRLSPEDISVRGDPSQLEQVLMNLAVNARDALAGAGTMVVETASVEVLPGPAETLRPGRYAVLSVRDGGVGMDASTVQRIFEPFFTTKEVGKGTGLGLSTVFGIVSQHQGKVLVDSVPGQGTTFRILLPRVDEPTRSPRQELPQGLMPTGRERVLVVEDDPSVRKLIQRVLEPLGYRVLPASGPEEARALFRDQGQEVDLLLTDMVMPGCSGLDLYRDLSAAQPDLRVLCISGYSEREAAPPREGGRGAFLAKPFTPGELARTVRALLDGTTAGPPRP